MLSPTYHSLPQKYPVKPRNCRLLLFSDNPERMKKMVALVNDRDLRITKVSTARELKDACRRKQDIAIVDAGPELIELLLDEIRIAPGTAKIPVLVATERIASEPGLAGVLPARRAMPCSPEQMAWLVRQNRISSIEDSDRSFGHRIL
ncbi:MAG: hypothetical protein IPM66_11850 [Acidobacteriota bacterium]|nr:MAG: hypothetical protein IPM66_11850 [Acidobacteriota bacterium]